MPANFGPISAPAWRRSRLQPEADDRHPRGAAAHPGDPGRLRALIIRNSTTCDVLDRDLQRQLYVDPCRSIGRDELRFGSSSASRQSLKTPRFSARIRASKILEFCTVWARNTCRCASAPAPHARRARPGEDVGVGRRSPSPCGVGLDLERRRAIARARRKLNFASPRSALDKKHAQMLGWRVRRLPPDASGRTGSSPGLRLTILFLHQSPHSNTTTCRTPIPSRKRSNPSLISSSLSRWVNSASTASLPALKRAM